MPGLKIVANGPEPLLRESKELINKKYSVDSARLKQYNGRKGEWEITATVTEGLSFDQQSFLQEIENLVQHKIEIVDIRYGSGINNY